MADLTALKNRHQGEVPNNQLNHEDILMDSLSDVLPFDVKLSSNQPVPQTPPEGPAQPPSMSQSIPLAVVNSGAMLQPPSLQPSPEMPTSGDLKSGDCLFFTPPPGILTNPPPPQKKKMDPAPNGNDLGHYMMSYMMCILSKFKIIVLMLEIIFVGD